ncbi:unnamed protein product, partial [Prunus brigantina]
LNVKIFEFNFFFCIFAFHLLIELGGHTNAKLTVSISTFRVLELILARPINRTSPCNLSLIISCLIKC